MYRILSIIFLAIVVTGCKQKQIYVPERGIENDRELMTRNMKCNVNDYRLVIQDSISYSKDSPYAFYYPDRMRNCFPNTIIITKLETDPIKKVKFTNLHLGDNKFQTLYTRIQEDTINFDFNDYHFNILKDTILVKVKTK